MKKVTIQSLEEVNGYIERINKSIEMAVENMKNHSGSPLQLFYNMKFNQIGLDPLADRSLNIIEQVNQTYTYLVSFKAVEHIYNHFHYEGEIYLNLGNVPGFDIETVDNGIVAEVFAATSVNSNQKLKMDIEKLHKSNTNAKKYVFYYTPDDESNKVMRKQEKYPDIKVIRIDI